VIVLDSSFIIGFHNERDAHNKTAVGLMDRFLAGEWGQGLLLEYVFLEVSTVLVARRGPALAARVGKLLLDAEELDFVPCSGLFSEAFKIFSQQRNTHLSFADAAIAHVARRHADGLVLTFDEELAKRPGVQVPSTSQK